MSFIAPPFGGSKGGYVLCLFLLLVATGIPCLWLHHSYLCLLLYITSSLCGIAFLIRTLVIALRANLDNPKQSPHFKIPNYICKEALSK